MAWINDPRTPYFPRWAGRPSEEDTVKVGVERETQYENRIAQLEQQLAQAKADARREAFREAEATLRRIYTNQKMNPDTECLCDACLQIRENLRQAREYWAEQRAYAQEREEER